MKAIKCQRTYKIKLYPTKAKAEEMRYTASRFILFLNYFVSREYFGQQIKSTVGMGYLANIAKNKARGIVRATKAMTGKTNCPHTIKEIYTTKIQIAQSGSFDFWVSSLSYWGHGRFVPAKSHAALNRSMKNGWVLSEFCEVFKEKDKWFCRVFVSKEVQKPKPSKKLIGVDVGMAHASSRSDGYLGKNLKPIMDKAANKQKQRNRNKFKKSLTTAKKTSVKQVLDAEVNSCIRRSKKLGANVVIESPKALANLKSGKMNRWARCYFANRLHVRAKEESVNVIEIWPSGTSTTCNKCGHKDKQSRKSQSVFNCTACGNVVNADINAALNIAEKGRLVYANKQ